MTSFLTDPPLYYDRHVFCCTNLRAGKDARVSCAASGSDALRDYFKKRVKKEEIPATRINSAGCLNRCELGPVLVIYPEGVWYGYKNEADLDEIIEVHLKQGGRVDRLMLKRDQQFPL